MERNIPIPHYTIHDYNQWQGDWELIYGYPYAMSPSPLPKHQIAGRKILTLLSSKINERKMECDCEVLYETDWKISEDTIVRPDIMIICGLFNESEVITRTPSLIVEIFSPATRLKDRNTKFTIYQQAGVKYYFMADPDTQSLECFHLENNVYMEVANEFKIELGEACSFIFDSNRVFEA
jgi:Uma2 family endonuclease